VTAKSASSLDNATGLEKKTRLRNTSAERRKERDTTRSGQSSEASSNDEKGKKGPLLAIKERKRFSKRIREDKGG